MKSSTYVRRLRVGDVFSDVDGVWVVTVAPEVIDGESVKISVSQAFTGKRKYSRPFLYDIDSRVKLHQTISGHASVA
jgi:hypothetical protein